MTTATLPSNQVAYSLADLVTLGNRYAPVVRFHPNEKYFMCSVDWYLQRATLRGKDGTNKPSPSISDLPRGTVDDGQYWLDMEDSAKPGDLSNATTYLRAYWPKGHDHIDLQYWFCYGYNGPGTLHAYNPINSNDADLSPLGEHWIDWEMVTVRIKIDPQQVLGVQQEKLGVQQEKLGDQHEVLGVFLSQHGSGDWITDLSQFERNKDQFIVYASLNGHALYAKPGTNPTNSYDVAGFGAYLRNDTASGGQQFDSSGKLTVVSADFIPGVTQPQWLFFPYRWGLGSKSYITLTAIIEILDGAFTSSLGWAVKIIGSSGINALGAVLLPRYSLDDTYGVYGPQTQSYWTSQLLPQYQIQNYYSNYTTNRGNSPSVSWFNKLFHIFFQDRNGTGIMHITSVDGVNWARPNDFYTGFTTTGGPCSVVFGNLLHVFFRDGSGNGILHMQSADGSSWQGAKQFYLGLNCDDQPAAAVLGNTLCVAAIDHGGNGIMCAVQTGIDGPWNNIYTGFNTNAGNPVGIISFNGLFHLFFRDHNGNGIMHITSSDGIHWEESSVFYTGFNTSSGPAPIVVDDSIYIFFRDGGNHDGIMYIQSADATNWTVAPGWYLGQNGDNTPRAACKPDGSAIVVAYIDAGGNGIMGTSMKVW